MINQRPAGSAEVLKLAGDLLTHRSVADGLWPRACALLGRQALEMAVSQLWCARMPEVASCSMRAQLLCLEGFLDNEEVAELVNHTWWALTRGCHHHPYELAPTTSELRTWLEAVDVIVREFDLTPP